ncbi:Homoserine O-acetyltransferase [Colletotrichum tanaceti]|nr:Homoserine O-acetyltransferase [Colletotrichum tanaceti]
MLQLKSGGTLSGCPVACKTWGKLNEDGNNVLVICHALTGSSDVGDWWKPLIGPGKAFDPRHFFIFCGNVLGSPYGSASPLSINPDAARQYASEFPQTTVRDDVKAHNLVLDALGVNGLFARLLAPGFVRNIIPIATSADHSAWGISWAETQRQCIYSDPKFDGGYYKPTPEGQPSAKLAAARMIAMLTYRSCLSFDRRFGRKPPRSLAKVREPPLDLPRTDVPAIESEDHDRNAVAQRRRDPSFSAQGYLHHQGEKFIRRFDANCYLHITNKMDSHDVAYGALVIGVETDALFLPEQQQRLAAHLPGASLSVLKSSDGHDGFLLEFEQLDALIKSQLRSRLPELHAVTHRPGDSRSGDDDTTTAGADGSLTRELDHW